MTWLSRLISLCVAVMIAYALLTPEVEGPSFWGVPWSDKINHALAFAVLALPTAVLVPRDAVWLIPIAAAFGLALEVIQPVFGRDYAFGDFIADVVGLLAGVGLGMLTRKFARKHRLI